MPALRTLLEAQALHTGLRWGAVATVCGLLVHAARRATSAGEDTAPPIMGLLLAGAVSAGMWNSGWPSGRLVLGLALLCAGGLAAALTPAPEAGGPLLALPGAWVITSGAELVSHWTQFFLVVAIVGAGTLLADFDRRWSRQGYAPVLLAVAALGAYVIVPDTERAALLLGTTVPLALLGWPMPIAVFGRVGSSLAIGSFAWVVAVDGRGRPASIIAGIACLGVLVVEPLVRVLSRRQSPFDRWARLPAPADLAIIAGAQLGLAAVARNAGLRHRPQEVVAVIVAVLVVALATGIVLARRPLSATLPDRRRGPCIPPSPTASGSQPEQHPR